MDQDDPERRLFLSLVALFRPYVAAVRMPKTLAWARSPYDKEEKKVLLSFWMTPMARLTMAEWKREKMLFRGLRAAVKETLKAVFNRPRISEAQIAASSERWTFEMTAPFVRGWLDTLEFVVPEAEGATIDPDILDSAMLPLLDEFEPTSIIRMCCEELSPEEVRGILRAVKASLPPGQLIPAEAIELLRFDPPEDPDPLDSFATIVEVD